MEPKEQYTEVIQTRLLMFGLQSEVGFAPADLEIDLQRKWTRNSGRVIKDLKQYFGVSLPKSSKVHTVENESEMGRYMMGTDKWNPVGLHRNTKPLFASRGFMEQGLQNWPWMSVLTHQINDIYANIYSEDVSSMTCITFYPVEDKESNRLSFIAIISDGNYRHNIALHITSQGGDSLLWRGGLNESPEPHALRVWSVRQYMPARWDEENESIHNEGDKIMEIESKEERMKYVDERMWQTIYLPVEH